MSEERLKEIYDYNNTEYCVGEYDINNEIIDELYNEVVRLREIIKEATQRVSGTTICGLRAGKSVIGTYLNELLDILKQNNITLEQLTGIDNE